MVSTPRPRCPRAPTRWSSCERATQPRRISTLVARHAHPGALARRRADGLRAAPAHRRGPEASAEPTPGPAVSGTAAMSHERRPMPPGASLAALVAAARGGGAGARHAAGGALGHADASARRSPAARLAGTRAEDCAPCHAREVAEWSASAMAFAARSPLVGALESLVEEQVGRDESCPNGAGVLRRAGRSTRASTTRSGSARDGRRRARAGASTATCRGRTCSRAMPAVERRAATARAAEPVRDLLPAADARRHLVRGVPLDHRTGRRARVRGPAATRATRRGPRSATGRDVPRAPRGRARPDRHRQLGLPPRAAAAARAARATAPACTPRRAVATERYLGVERVLRRVPRRAPLRDRRAVAPCAASTSSDCATHTRSGARGRTPRRAPGARRATCQDCHMSLYPGVRLRWRGRRGCPAGTHFSAKAPGQWARDSSRRRRRAPTPVASHWFTSVDLPLSPRTARRALDDASLDANGVPVGLRARRDAAARAARSGFALGDGRSGVGSALEVP